MADLKAANEQLRLVHPDIIAEIPGVETEDMYNNLIGTTPINKEEYFAAPLSIRIIRIATGYHSHRRVQNKAF